MSDEDRAEYFGVGLMFGMLAMGIIWITGAFVTETEKVTSGYLTHLGKSYKVELAYDPKLEDSKGELE